MQRTCANPWCHQPFAVTEEDIAFYENIAPAFAGKKVLIPTPIRCPDCRLQQKLASRNERSLHHRACDLCGKRLIAMYRADADFPVYCLDCWWSDRWNPLSLGQPMNTGTFFEQFRVLASRVPRQSLRIHNSLNCDYSNWCRDGKNCYLIFSAIRCEQCSYCSYIDDSTFCFDCENVDHGELLYECNNCVRCHSCVQSMRCENCQDSAFLFDCRNCHHCCLSTNQRGKSYLFENVQRTPEEYERCVASLRLETQSGLTRTADHFLALARGAIHHNQLTHCEECTGDFLIDCKQCRECFESSGGEDSARCYRCPYSFKDSLDSWGVYGSSELCLEIMNGKNLLRNIATVQSQDLQDAAYCLHCYSSHHLFGCIGLNHAQYCILNKQYSKEEYEKLVPQIITKMRTDGGGGGAMNPSGARGSWGEFFPISLSPFAYNETVAQEYFPLTKEEALQRGWQWREEVEEMPKVSKVIPAEKLPDSIDDIPDDILNWAIIPEGGDPSAKQPFRIIKQELEFYRKMKLPIPRLHPDERHRRRMALRNPRKLWNRACAKCGNAIATSYAPERTEIVYCENCYLREVY